MPGDPRTRVYYTCRPNDYCDVMCRKLRWLRTEIRDLDAENSTLLSTALLDHETAIRRADTRNRDARAKALNGLVCALGYALQTTCTAQILSPRLGRLEYARESRPHVARVHLSS